MTSTNNPHRPRVGLTGSRGVLGRSLQQYCTDFEWVPFPGDIRHLSEVQSWLESAGLLDAVIHLAAMVPTQRVEESPPQALRTNVEGTCNLLEVIRTTTAGSARPWLFISSSSHVYASSNQPLREDSPVVPVTLYGLTKHQAEQWALAYSATFKLPICIGRIFSYTSRWQPPSYFIPSLIRKISKSPHEAVLEIPGLHGSRDFVTTKQISQAVQVLFEKREEGIFNIGSGKAQSLLDIAHAIQRRLGRMDVRIVALDTGTTHLTANVSKLAQTGLVLGSQLEAALDELLEQHST
jgi:nucleoside-diphosphate-sugar epimerase